MINTNPSTPRGTAQLNQGASLGAQTSVANATQVADVASKPGTGTLAESFTSSANGQKSNLGFPPATTQAADPAAAVETQEATNNKSDATGTASPGGRTSNRGTPSGSA